MRDRAYHRPPNTTPSSLVPPHFSSSSRLVTQPDNSCYSLVRNCSHNLALNRLTQRVTTIWIQDFLWTRSDRHFATLTTLTLKVNTQNTTP